GQCTGNVEGGGARGRHRSGDQEIRVVVQRKAAGGEVAERRDLVVARERRGAGGAAAELCGRQAAGLGQGAGDGERRRARRRHRSGDQEIDIVIQREAAGGEVAEWRGLCVSCQRCGDGGVCG